MSILVKFYDTEDYISIPIDDLKKSNVILNILEDTFEPNYKDKLDLTKFNSCSFITYKNFKKALVLSDDTIDNDLYKFMDFLNLEKKYISEKEYKLLCKKPFKYYKDEDWKIYIKWTKISNEILKKIINILPIKYIKILINKNNINNIYIKYDVYYYPLIYYVNRMDVIDYFLELNIDKTLPIMIDNSDQGIIEPDIQYNCLVDSINDEDIKEKLLKYGFKSNEEDEPMEYFNYYSMLYKDIEKEFEGTVRDTLSFIN